MGVPQQNNFDQIIEYFCISGVMLIPLKTITDLLPNSVGARLGSCVILTNKNILNFFSAIHGV